jgi:hypothetical protein
MKTQLIILGFLMAFNYCYSQPGTDITDSATKANVKKDKPAQTIQSSGHSGFLSYQSFTKLNATNDGASAEANINYLDKKAVCFNLNISTPVSSKTQQVKPLTITGITNNTAVNIGVQKIWWGNHFKWGGQKAYNKAIESVGGNIMDFTNTDYDNLSKEQKEKFEKIASINWGTAFYLGGKAGFEQQDFNYFIDSSVSYDAEEKSKTAVVLSATIGILYNKGNFALTYTYKDGYLADDPLKYSIPIARGGFVEKELSPGPPGHQISNRIRFEFLSTGGEGKNFRANPNINIELNQKFFSFELPVYFLKTDDKAPSLNGGIYAGYVSDKDFTFNFKKANLGFGVFIGANIKDLFR